MVFTSTLMETAKTLDPILTRPRYDRMTIQGKIIFGPTVIRTYIQNTIFQSLTNIAERSWLYFFNR